MSISRNTALGCLLLAVSAASGAATPGETQAASMRSLAGELGCTVCHRDASTAKAADPSTPLAPSWQEIAKRYRGQRGAEARLARIVTHGADDAHPHWHDRLEFSRMQGNGQRVSPQQARVLVRWILSSR